MLNINQIKIADNNQANAISDFNNHLVSLFRFPFEDKTLREKFKGKNFTWSLANYDSFSQFSLENTHLVEETELVEPDWDWVDEQRHYLKKHLKNLLGKEADSNYLKPMINWTLDSFDNYLSYNAMHPNSLHNPWTSMYKILTKYGYLFLATEDKDISKEYLGEKYQNNSSNYLTFITSSNPKNPRTNYFRQFLVNNFCDIELKIFDYLQTEALGFENAKSLQTIHHFLIEKCKMNVSLSMVKNIIKYLKQNGYIGSEGFKGYFMIVSEDDLIQTYQQNEIQIKDLERTMRIYQKKAKQMGIENFMQKVQRM